MKKNLVFATQNRHKLEEVRKIIPQGYMLLGLHDIGCVDAIEETALTLEGNADLKARYVYEKYGLDCFADDTGLEVEALGGRPGVFSARYAGEETDDDGRRWEVVELTFEGGTGLTPQNMYRAFVNPETGRMERWHFLSNPDANPSPSEWTDWRRVGPIELSENRRSGGEIRIFYPHLRVETEVPAGVFDPPA